MIRHDTYGPDGTLSRRIEVERTSADAATTTIWTEGEGEQTRAATDREYAALVAHERGEASEERRTDLRQAISTLRDWAEQAQGTTVTNGNNTAVTQVLVDRLGIFFARFADLLDEQYGDE